MRFLIILINIICFNCILCKINVKKLTESMGQEVIELGSVKELPPGLEEEPSAENEEDSTSTTQQAATKKEVKKIITTNASTSKNSSTAGKDVTDSVSQEDEEARIEKELAEMYKDNADYKADSGEKENGTNFSESLVNDYEKPIGRKAGSFNFQPDSTNKADVERFRTSVDEISCDTVTPKKLLLEEQPSNSSIKFIFDFILFGITLIVTNN